MSDEARRFQAKYEQAFYTDMIAHDSLMLAHNALAILRDSGIEWGFPTDCLAALGPRHSIAIIPGLEWLKERSREFEADALKAYIQESA